MSLVEVPGTRHEPEIGLQPHGAGIQEGVGGDGSLRSPRIGTVHCIVNAGISGRAEGKEGTRGDRAALAIQKGWPDELPVNEVDAVGQPVLHQVNLVLVGATAGVEAPSRHLTGLSLPHLVGDAVNQAIEMGQRKARATQFLPTIHPELPKIRVTEQPGPPRGLKERAGVPLAGIGIAAIGRAQRAIEVPMRTEDELPITGLVEIGAQHQGVDITAQNFQDVVINPRRDVFPLSGSKRHSLTEEAREDVAWSSPSVSMTNTGRVEVKSIRFV